MSNFLLNATLRKKERNSGKKSISRDSIPAIMYNKDENIPITLTRREFQKAFNYSKTNTIFNIILNKKKYQVYIKDYSESLNSSRSIEHIDFFLLADGIDITIDIPLELIGNSIGVTRGGGYIENYLQKLTVKCPSNEIKEKITIDISSLDIGGRIYVKDVKTDEKIKILNSLDTAIVAVMISSKAKSE